MTELKRILIEPKGYSKHFEDIKNIFENRITVLEKKMDILINTCSSILSYFEGKNNEHECCSTLVLNKLNLIEEFITAFPKLDIYKDKTDSNAPVILLNDGKTNESVETRNSHQVIVLNTEEEIPDGSWLGDQDNPKCRVRVKISPSNLFHINERCHTPQKMALTLLDCLFPREVLAVSNLSGKGKHCKEQLDPLLIYAIRCHLIYKFNITEEEWHKIKQNIDSKCRAVWRKKMKGLPLQSMSTNPNNLMFSEPLSEESLDGYQPSTNFSPIKVLKNGKDQQHPGGQDGQTVKVFSDDEIKDLLSSSVELFYVDDSNCFNLGGNNHLVITENSDADACEKMTGLDEDQLS
ncbi:protein BANP-like [Cimex lectularius]|uniref:Protein BANP n=1 Tax=Cimex lectularius TaxID=79782 RepID=A0A8I6RMJ7_CIMLE|nr:protein BANP-like [Cimex lectularius]